MVDFVDPSTYRSLRVSEMALPGGSAAAGGGGSMITIATLPAGSTVYRADDSGKKTPSTGVPVFFGDKATIEPYTVDRYGNRRVPREDTISSYKTNKDLRLFVMTKSNFDTLVDAVPDDTGNFVRRNYLLSFPLSEESLKTLQKNLAFPITNPVHAIRPDAETSRVPGTKYVEYSNRRLARILCELGFDGWVSFPNTLLEYAGRSLHYYTSEVVICRWEEVSSRIGGRRTRRRQTRKKRRL